MRLLLDTNVLLWATAMSRRLDPQTRSLLDDRANTVMFSAVSIWEIAIKAGLGRADFTVDPRSILDSALESGLIELPLQSALAATVGRLPSHHKDPFDRLLIAQALAEPAVLLTTDRALLRYSDLVTLVESRPA